MVHKWLAIMFIGMFGSLFVGVAVSEVAKHNCQTELGKAGRDAADIERICK